jgi:hypothetical protein
MDGLRELLNKLFCHLFGCNIEKQPGHRGLWTDGECSRCKSKFMFKDKWGGEV